jgi:hypothetical protein
MLDARQWFKSWAKTNAVSTALPQIIHAEFSAIIQMTNN